MLSGIVKGRVFDVRSKVVIEDGLIAIEDGRIVYAGPSEDFSRQAEDVPVYSFPGGSVLPGFIDCHAHLSGEENAGSFADGRFYGDQLLGGAYQCGLILDAGFTGVRDMSENGLYLSRAVERGILRGPKILPGGKVLGITSGHVDLDPMMSKEDFNRTSHLCRLTDGVDDCVMAVREQFRAGAKFIKLCATGGVSSPTDRLDDVQFSPEELKAIADEAKRHHSYACAHCVGSDGTYQALLAGITCIEHGMVLTEREVELMKTCDATLVTTLCVSLGVARIPNLPEWMARKVKSSAEAHVRSVRMARDAGIRIALGTDFTNSPNSSYLELGREFEAITKAGLSNWEAIQAGTIHAAHLMMNEEETGSLDVGKCADLVVVDGNPLEDIGCLTHADHVKLVMLDGCIKKNLMN